MAKIIPGILTADEEEYHKRLLLAEHVSDLIQIDVIDGKFLANTTIGIDIIKKYPTSCMLEVQLMVVYPQNYISELSLRGYVFREALSPGRETLRRGTLELIKSYGK